MNTAFGGLRVAAFESRLAEPTAQLITRHGGQPSVAPSLRELPLEQNTDAIRFAEQLFRGGFDMVILLTGVGARTLAAAVETRYPRSRFVEALQRTTIVARGPKPVAALRELGITTVVRAPEPNTWHEILTTLDAHAPVSGRHVAVQEYGQPNWELLEGLKQRGAQVTRVPVYRWTLPEDLEPLRRVVKAIAAGEVDVVLWTNAAQITNVLQVAGELSAEEAFRAALDRMVIASIGPTCSEALKEHGLSVDFEPSHSKLAICIKELAEHSQELLQRKRHVVVRPNRPTGSTGQLAQPDALRQSVFMKACRLEPTDVTPVWFMRQAGRYMLEYRNIRQQGDLLALCKKPSLAADITVTAVQRLGVDAAILFADLLLIAEPLGFKIEYTKGEGPVVRQPIRAPGDVDRLKPVRPEESLGFVYEAIRLIRRALPQTPLIGFAGAPFTVASYLIEGGASRDLAKTKMLMHRHPAMWRQLMDHLAQASAEYLNGQITAGVQAVQVFDSWVGCLSPDDYRQHVLSHSQAMIRRLTPGTPVIHFGTQTAGLLELMREAGGQVIGVDWRIGLADAWRRLGPGVGIQGNLDPLTLFAEPQVIRAETKRILDEAAGRPGHIFNVGHGILPRTPETHVKALVEMVHEMSQRR